MGAVTGAAIACFLGYGVSLFVLGLRYLGAARTSAYSLQHLSSVRFFRLLLVGEAVSAQLVLTAALMGVGLYLHLVERHEHEHLHEEMEHEHRHVHDEHHQHVHGPDDPQGELHAHRHRHGRLRHSHPHYPDLHHRHEHGRWRWFTESSGGASALVRLWPWPDDAVGACPAP